MAVEDGERWDARYADREVDVAPAPPDVLIEADLVRRVPTRGRALDVACGLGAQTIWLAQRGLDVTALDVSDEAVDRVDDAALRHKLRGRVTAVTVDLDDGLPADLTELDVIVCQRFRDPRLYSDFLARLRCGGLLVVTVLSETGASEPGSFHAPPGELRSAFDRDDCTILHHAEADGQESIVVQSNA